VGYVPGAEQEGAARTAILVLISIVPAIGHVLAAIVLRGFSLDEAEHARIRAVLDARASAADG
jgi:Na+/melibiose symporter-like transporter